MGTDRTISPEPFRGWIGLEQAALKEASGLRLL
jgi:hypothetical protein